MKFFLLFLLSCAGFAYAEDATDAVDAVDAADAGKAQEQKQDIVADSLKESRERNPNDEEVVIKARRYQGPEEYSAAFEKDTSRLRLHNNKVHSVQELLLDRAEQVQSAVIQQAIKAERNK